MNREVIITTIKELLGALDVSHDSVEVFEGEPPRFLIKTNESGLLIGFKGAHFAAISHLIHKIVNKRLGRVEGDEKGPRFVVDVNDYHQSAVELMKNKVKILAERARSLRADVTMDPMSAYERMIIHSLCQNEANIKTESVGEGKDRRVVIKYIESQNI